MKFVELAKKLLSGATYQIIRPVDLELLKETIMETEEFQGVIVFNVIKDRDERVKTAVMRPGVDKFNTVVNIYSIYLFPSPLEGPDLMVQCFDDTIIRN